VVENFRPGVLEKLGLGWEVLVCELNPGLVMVRLSGFGQSGPMAKPAGLRRDRRIDGRAALHHRLSRPPAGEDRHLHRRLDRRACGALGALMALRHREVNGGAGQVVDVALYEAVFAMMESRWCPSSTCSASSASAPATSCPASPPRTPIPPGRQAPDHHRRQRRCDLQAPDARDRPRTIWRRTRTWPTTPAAMRAPAEIYSVIDAWVAQPTTPKRCLRTTGGGPGARPARIYSVADMFSDPAVPRPARCWNRRNSRMGKSFVFPALCQSCHLPRA
jgi:formyl-CoA transferase